MFHRGCAPVPTVSSPFSTFAPKGKVTAPAINVTAQEQVKLRKRAHAMVKTGDACDEETAFGKLFQEHQRMKKQRVTEMTNSNPAYIPASQEEEDETKPAAKPEASAA